MQGQTRGEYHDVRAKPRERSTVFNMLSPFPCLCSSSSCGLCRGRAARGPAPHFARDGGYYFCLCRPPSRLCRDVRGGGDAVGARHPRRGCGGDAPALAPVPSQVHAPPCPPSGCDCAEHQWTFCHRDRDGGHGESRDLWHGLARDGGRKRRVREAGFGYAYPQLQARPTPVGGVRVLK